MIFQYYNKTITLNNNYNNNNNNNNNTEIMGHFYITIIQQSGGGQQLWILVYTETVTKLSAMTERPSRFLADK